VRRVGVRRKLVCCQGLGWYPMLEGVGCPKGGVGMCIVE